MRIREEVVVLESAGQIGKRATDIGGDDIEQRLRGRREETDAQVAVQEEYRNVGAVKDVLEVVGRRALLLDSLVQLAIEGRELLIEGLQLFLRRFSFSLADWDSALAGIASLLIALPGFGNSARSAAAGPGRPVAHCASSLSWLS